MAKPIYILKKPGGETVTYTPTKAGTKITTIPAPSPPTSESVIAETEKRLGRKLTQEELAAEQQVWQEEERGQIYTRGYEKPHGKVEAAEITPGGKLHVEAPKGVEVNVAQVSKAATEKEAGFTRYGILLSQEPIQLKEKREEEELLTPAEVQAQLSSGFEPGPAGGTREFLEDVKYYPYKTYTEKKTAELVEISEEAKKHLWKGTHEEKTRGRIMYIAAKVGIGALRPFEFGKEAFYEPLKASALYTIRPSPESLAFAQKQEAESRKELLGAGLFLAPVAVGSLVGGAVGGGIGAKVGAGLVFTAALGVTRGPQILKDPGELISTAAELGIYAGAFKGAERLHAVKWPSKLEFDFTTPKWEYKMEWIKPATQWEPIRGLPERFYPRPQEITAPTTLMELPSLSPRMRKLTAPPRYQRLEIRLWDGEFRGLTIKNIDEFLVKTELVGTTKKVPKPAGEIVTFWEKGVAKYKIVYPKPKPLKPIKITKPTGEIEMLGGGGKQVSVTILEPPKQEFKPPKVRLKQPTKIKQFYDVEQVLKQLPKFKPFEEYMVKQKPASIQKYFISQIHTPLQKQMAAQQVTHIYPTIQIPISIPKPRYKEIFRETPWEPEIWEPLWEPPKRKRPTRKPEIWEPPKKQPYEPEPPWVPPPTGFKIPKIDIWPKRQRRGFGISRKPQKKYEPTMTSLLWDITAPAKQIRMKGLTGFEMRPIPLFGIPRRIKRQRR